MIAEALKIAKEVLVKPFEGYHRKLPNGDCRAYPDPGTGGVPWTIGWGCTGPDIKPDTVWTMAQAEKALDAELEHFALGLVRLSPTIKNEKPSRIAALISFCYNCGLGNYRISTLKKRVDKGDWTSAQEEIIKWNKAAGRVLPGLTRRRLAEAALLK